MPLFCLCLSALLSTTVPFADTNVIHTAAELNALRTTGKPGAFPFDITGTVACGPNGTTLVISDQTGTTDISRKTPAENPTPGDVVRLTGETFQDYTGKRLVCAYETKRIGTANIPTPKAATVRELTSGRFDFTVVRTSGTVVDTMPDQIDASFDYAILSDEGKFVVVSYRKSSETEKPQDHLRSLIGACVEIVGYCNPTTGNLRRFHAHGLLASIADTRIITPADNAFDAPVLDDAPFTEPENLFSLSRRRVDGTVLAAWRQRHLLVKTDNKRLVQALTPTTTALPKPGEFIRIVGFPETDLFTINLSNARWRPAEGAAVLPKEPEPATVRDIMPCDVRRQYDPHWHGRLIRLKGRIREILQSPTDGRMLLSSDGELVYVDISSCYGQTLDAPVDAETEVTGICLWDVSDWRPAVPFPSIRGFRLIVRSPEDVAVLSRPSWWTTGRLLTALGGLLLVTLGIGVWNVLLKRASDRKGREIAAQQMTIVESELKVCERTRLSVELHDALSQILSAVSMQIDAVRRYANRDSEKMNRHLDIAAKTIGSCQTELRNCLWDLRNSTLDDDDLDVALRRTLVPHVGDAQLDVRVNVPRDRLSDKTAHTILRIVRELATNAVRHGEATCIKVAGLVDGDRLMVSVRDNGYGFNPDATPGINEGHFGLQGVRERIEELDGEFTIESTPGHGTRIVLRLPISEDAGA